MKKIFFLAFAVSLFSLAGCSGGKPDDATNTNIPQGMIVADLSEQGLNVLVNVPDSTVGILEVSTNTQGGADVKVGKNFQMTVLEGPGDIALQKNDIMHDDIRKFIKYVVEEPNALVWEWQIDGMESEFHFYAIVKDGDKTFEVRDVVGEIFSEKAAVQMLDAAKSIRVKSAAKSES